MMQQSPSPISFANPETAVCPFPAYKQLRDTQPVYHDPKTGLFEVVDAALMRKAAMDVENFSNLLNRQSMHTPALQKEIEDLYQAEGFVAVPTLLNNDGDSHRRYRSLVDRAFTVGRINALLPAIRAEVDELLAACEASTEIEFVQQFAIPLPLNIIVDQLGVDRSDHLIFKAGSDAMMNVTDPLTPAHAMLGYVRDIIRMQQVLAERVKRVRERPDDTIFGIVANSEVDGEYLTVSMMVNLFQGILVAGNETTTNALGNSLQMLIDDPALRARLASDEDHARGLVRNFVEEALRLRAPLQGFFRLVRHDTELGGVAIPAGAIIMLRWGAGGLDEKLFKRPEELDLNRKAISQHTSFGHGVHFCIGNQLARAELRLAVDQIARRWPKVRLSDRADAITPVRSYFAHGPRSMYLRID